MLFRSILFAYLLVEGGTVGGTPSENRNGSRDIGIAQVNSIHLPELREFSISEVELQNDGCLNLAVAARYALRVMAELHETPATQEAYLHALARFHSKSPEQAHVYAEKLKSAFRMLYEHSDYR